MLAANSTYGCHVGTLAVQVNRNDRLCPGRDSGSDLLGIDQRVILPHIYDDRPRSGQRNGKGRGGESHGRHDHFVARTDVQRAAGEVKRIRSACNPDCGRDAAIFGKLAFEQRYFFTKNEVAPLDNPGDRCSDFLRDRLTLCPQVDQRYCSTKIRETAQEVQRAVRRGYFRSVNFISSESAALGKIRGPENRRNGLVFKRSDSKLRGFFRIMLLADNSAHVKGFGEAEDLAGR